jgi:hypothetical protein
MAGQGEEQCQEDNGRAHERAVKALRIVLSHWMLPDLGWHMHQFEEELPKLRDTILQQERELWSTLEKSKHRGPMSGDNNQSKKKGKRKESSAQTVDIDERINRLQSNLCNTPHYIDTEGINQRMALLGSLDRSEFIPVCTMVS